MAVAVAKWLVLATGICTRKRVQSAIGKMRWLARPHDFLSPVLGGPIAHSLWGPRFLPHTPIATLRGFDMQKRRSNKGEGCVVIR